MTVPTVVSKKSDEPILIVDKEGLIGEKLAGKLKEEAVVVLVSEKISKLEDIVHIPYDKQFPQIPDNKYSHIFVIDDGSKVTREALPSFLEKAENDNAVFLFAAHLREINEKLINDLTGYYQKAKILFFGDIFGGGAPNEPEAYVNKFIAEARLKNKILVPQEGTSVTYPIFFEDLIEGLLESVFGRRDEKVFYSFPKYPPTLLSLAQMIQKSNPHVSLDFSEEKAMENIDIPADGKYLLDEKYELELRIKKIEIGEKPFVERSEEEEIKDGKAFKFLFPQWGFLGILFLILLPLISSIVLSLLGNITLRGAELYFDKGDLEKAQKSSFFARTYFNLAEKTASVIPFFGISNFFEKDQNRVSGASFIFEGLKSQDFAEIKKGLVFLQKEKVNFPLISFATSTIDSWEEVLGIKNKKRYLLLVQDKNELRPTGGIIDSFSVITLDKGKLLSFEVKDANVPDAKAKGKVEPPFPIRRYLKSTNLAFKDANFNVDFTESGSASAILLSVLEEEKVDGVVALDKSVYEKIKEELDKKNISYTNLLKLIDEGISNKDILFSFNDSNLQNIFMANGWSSSLWDLRKEKGLIINDFLGINEANLSKNKINKSIKRNVSQNVKLDENGNTSTILTINYRNEASEEYKNYLRIIAPLNSKISEIKINEKVVKTRNAIKDPKIYEAKNFKEPEELEVDQYDQNEKTIFGFLLKIGAKAIEEVQITYELSKKVDLDSHVSYNLKIFKQPYLSFPYKFSISYPSSFKITGGKKTLEKQINKDETILVELVKI